MSKPVPDPELPEHATSARRSWLRAVLAGGAAVAGLGLAWWRGQRPEAPPVGDEFGLWALEFATPQGGILQMAALRGRPLIINFWATWCPPCVEELPLLNGFYQQNVANGMQVIGLAVDQLVPVQRFVSQKKIAFPIALAGLSGIDLSRKLGNANGGLPFTAMFASDGRLAQRKIGRLGADDLRLWSHAN